ncbi:protein phosphatase 1 regulatory subunit 3G [Aulostomus maculatus]
MSRSPLQLHAGGESPSPGLSAENGLGDLDEENLDDELDASHLEKFMRDRRRARSLPAYPAALLDGVSGSEGRKRVKFADSMGLNLASVKHFSALEEPQIPSKVLSRHQSFPPQAFLSDLRQSLQSLEADRLVTCFPDPRDVDQRVRLLRVCLERVSITQFDVRGTIRVMCDCADRGVGLRYTFNEWLSHVDTQALPAGPPGLPAERYTFTVGTPPFTDPGSALHFAVYLRCDEGEFWDNNAGRNYTLRCLCVPSAALLSTPPERSARSNSPAAR